MPEIITVDGAFDIAFGKSRNETNWRNKDWLWSTLVERLSRTHYTAETHAEYLASKKDRQDEIKDVGGFVGGYITSGRRKSHNILHRQLLTLDIDYGKLDFWDDYTIMYGNAAVLYSTHKHSDKAPRYRLVMPLDRAVRPDEYEAIARRVAGNLDIEVFDPTTFQRERLMYWPSTSTDSEYVFEFQDGAFLCADTVLASYRNWADVSEWPLSSRVDKVLTRSMLKQGDPLEKPGAVGAFCRAYTISEAIETFLCDVYELCDTEDRYTYKEGSTAAGLVTYEDKFAFSHHGTDPTSGKLCNAFDLVRLHKFGLKDEDARKDTPSNKLPSYLAMVEYAVKDANVRVLLVDEKLTEARASFAGLIETNDNQQTPGRGEESAAKIDAYQLDLDLPIEHDWKKQLEVDRKGNFYPTINNIVLILTNDPLFKNVLAYDDFEKREVARKDLPWRKITYQSRYLTDEDDDCIQHYLETVYGIGGAKLSIAQSVINSRTKYHPIKDYLDKLEWDGTSRVDTLFIDYMGANDNAYVRAVTRKILCAAVARIYQPGCKFDYAVVFNGPEGLGKSSLIGKLGSEWFSESFSTVHGKEAIEQVQGIWLGELAELSGFRNADVETIKQYISKRVDRYRVAYGKRVENFPRQCVFFGTTNKKDFLISKTGNRRFWPIDTGRPAKNVFTDLTQDEINQVWAEVVELYSVGEPLYLSKEIEELAFAAQADHAENDERIGLILSYLDMEIPNNWYGLDIHQKRGFIYGDDNSFDYEGDLLRRDRVCAAEIYCEALGGMFANMTSHNTRFIHEIMRCVPGWLEYDTRTTFKGYGNQKGYYRDLRTVTTVEKINVEKTTVRTLEVRKALK